MAKRKQTARDKKTGKQKYSKDFISLIETVKGKRPRTVIDHILKHGYITTEELSQKYGYDHAPRAARDVRELGIKLETYKVKSKDGRTIAAYRFDKSCLAGSKTLSVGRVSFPKAFKNEMVKLYGAKCNICSATFASTILQIDHRVPYEVAGEVTPSTRKTDEFMLLCGSCNRAKSWSCEHCANWLQQKDPAICMTCYWGHPEAYKHIALQPIRRLDVVWEKDEVGTFDKLREQTEKAKKSMPDYVKRLIQHHLSDEE